jgi:hypothetical protein
MWANSGSREQGLRSFEVTVPADQLLSTRVFVAAPYEGGAREDFAFTVHADDDAEAMARKDAVFERPGG